MYDFTFTTIIYPADFLVFYYYYYYDRVAFANTNITVTILSF